jgi:tRNA pseudouridine55 synthase
MSEINGIINVYKEKGYTSFDVVAKLRGILHEKKIGHTGTLDPDAEGVLPVCIGNATKVCELLTDKDKEYEAVLHLGLTSDTGDATGKILEDKSREAEQLTEEAVRRAILGFVGDYDQVPPMYSALKVNGKKLCDLAREGITVERKPRRVHIYDIEIVDISIPFATMRVHCSKGTYIRTLCEDIGRELHVGGLMERLVRTRVSRFALSDAFTIAQIEACRDAGTLAEILLPVDGVFEMYPALHVRPEAAKKLYNGNRLSRSDIQEDFELRSEAFRLYGADGRFYGLYAPDGTKGELKSKKMFL